MLKKRIIAAGVAAMFTVPAFAGSMGEWVADGQALYEVWIDTNQPDQSGDTFNDPQVFTLHEIGLGSTKSMGGGNRFTWHVMTRIRNAERENGWANREAWVGVESDSWGQVAMGNFLSQNYLVVNWPYSCDAGLCELNAETPGHFESIGNAIRYSSPSMGSFNFIALYGVGNQGNGIVNGNYTGDFGERSQIIELTGHLETKVAKVDISYQQATDADPAGPQATFDQAAARTGAFTKELFIGTRINVGPGMEVVLANINKKVNAGDAATGFCAGGGCSWWMSSAFNGSNATEATQNVTFAQFKYSFGSSLIGFGVTAFDKSDTNNTVSGADPDDKALSWGLKYNVAPARGVNLFAYLRHHHIDGTSTPSVGAWQVQNARDGEDTMRIGVGGQLLF